MANIVIRNDQGIDFGYSARDGVCFPKVVLDSGNFLRLQAIEGTATTVEAIIFDRLSGKVVITNDHLGNKVLSVKVDPNQADYCTILAGETLSMDFSTDGLIVNGDSVPYRIWVFSE